MIRFIPSAIVDNSYKWMANFWAYAQKKAYKEKALFNSLVTVVKQNTYDSAIHGSLIGI